MGGGGACVGGGGWSLVASWGLLLLRNGAGGGTLKGGRGSGLVRTVERLLLYDLGLGSSVASWSILCRVTADTLLALL